MSKTEEGAPRKKSGKLLGLTWGTWIALAVLMPVCVMTFNLLPELEHAARAAARAA